MGHRQIQILGGHPGRPHPPPREHAGHRGRTRRSGRRHPAPLAPPGPGPAGCPPPDVPSHPAPGPRYLSPLDPLSHLRHRTHELHPRCQAAGQESAPHPETEAHRPVAPTRTRTPELHARHGQDATSTGHRPTRPARPGGQICQLKRGHRPVRTHPCHTHKTARLTRRLRPSTGSLAPTATAPAHPPHPHPLSHPRNQTPGPTPPTRSGGPPCCTHHQAPGPIDLSRPPRGSTPMRHASPDAYAHRQVIAPPGRRARHHRKPR